MARIDAASAGGQNRVAFLDMVSASEIGASLLALTDDGYNVLVGATPSNVLTFDSYAAHSRCEPTFPIDHECCASGARWKRCTSLNSSTTRAECEVTIN